MDNKSCHSSGDSTTTTAGSSGSGNRDEYLRHLNKLSHKISKPGRRPGPAFDPHHQSNLPPVPMPPPQQPAAAAAQNLQQQTQNQPPVYNINKSDFRDVVQKLTGSPAHERFSTPPPIQQPRPPSSRLQRIRPPPLAQISKHPSPLLNSAAPPQPRAAAINTNNNPVRAGAGSNGNFVGGNQAHGVAPLSPLPPFPAVHAAAESPISAYMRYLHGSMAGASPLAPLVSPRWNTIAPLPGPPNQPQPLPLPPQAHAVRPPTTSGPPPQATFPMPSSPLAFGCMPSPRSPCPLLFSPSTTGPLGFQPFPLSPRLPVPSPRWKDL